MTDSPHILTGQSRYNRFLILLVRSVHSWNEFCNYLFKFHISNFDFLFPISNLGLLAICCGFRLSPPALFFFYDAILLRDLSQKYHKGLKIIFYFSKGKVYCVRPHSLRSCTSSFWIDSPTGTPLSLRSCQASHSFSPAV